MAYNFDLDIINYTHTPIYLPKNIFVENTLLSNSIFIDYYDSIINNSICFYTDGSKGDYFNYVEGASYNMFNKVLS